MQETLVQFLGGNDCPQNGIGYPFQYSWASLVAQTVKNLSALRKTWVRSLGWEDPLLKGTATHSSIPACRIPMDRGDWQVTVHGVGKSCTWLKQQHSTHIRKLKICEFVLLWFFKRVIKFWIKKYKHRLNEWWEWPVSRLQEGFIVYTNMFWMGWQNYYQCMSTYLVFCFSQLKPLTCMCVSRPVMSNSLGPHRL